MSLSCLKSRSKQGWFLSDTPRKNLFCPFPTSKACQPPLPHLCFYCHIAFSSVKSLSPTYKDTCDCTGHTHNPGWSPHLKAFYLITFTMFLLLYKETYLQVLGIQMETFRGSLYPPCHSLMLPVLIFLSSCFRQLWNIILF